MYTRDILTPPKHLVQNGKPVFGTFENFPEKLDIRGVEAPFAGIPLPHIITNFRIKSSLVFMFNIGPYIGTIDFFDQKILGYAEVVFWSKENKRKYTYRSIMGPRRRFIPHSLQSGFCASFSKNRYIRISWDHARNRISLIFNLKGDSSRPTARAAFVAHYSEQGMTEITSSIPSPTKSRCSATYTATPAIRGSLTLGKTKLSEPVTMEDISGHAIFSINRTYYNFHVKQEFVMASGVIDGKQVSFQIFMTMENAVDAEKLNNNILCVNGQCTPLPPVTITHPFGIAKKWVIQDFDNMVDLTFTPAADHFRDMTLFITRSQVHTLYGTFEGSVKTKDNENIALHNFDGIARNQAIRL